MKTLRDYITESETWMHTPAEGDSFAIELADGTLIESYIFELAEDSILLDATAEIVKVLESWNLLSDQESDDAVILETMGYGTLVGEEDVDESWKSKLAGAALAGAAMLGGAGAHAGGVSIGPDGQPDLKGFTAQQQQTMNQKMSQQRDLGDGFAQTTVKFAGRDLPAVIDTESGTYITLNRNPEGYAILRTPQKYILIKDGKPQAANDLGPATMQALQKAGLIDAQPGVKEAKYHGREVPLGKPMAGDVKKSKVYVRDPATGNIKKVNFGDPNMRIKKSSPGHRKSFRARHHCENPGPKTKARYWSCRAW
jgi:hypothetical protein